MNVLCKCEVCGATWWARGYAEPDVGIFGAACEDDPMEEACEHVKAGGGFVVVDSEYVGYEED